MNDWSNYFMPFWGTVVGGLVSILTAYFVTRSRQHFEKLKKTSEMKEACFWYYCKHLSRFLHDLHHINYDDLNEKISGLVDKFSLSRFNEEKSNSGANSIDEVKESTYIIALELFLDKRHERLFDKLEQIRNLKYDADRINESAKKVYSILGPRSMKWKYFYLIVPERKQMIRKIYSVLTLRSLTVPEYDKAEKCDKLIFDCSKHSIRKQLKYAKKILLDKQGFVWLERENAH